MTNVFLSHSSEDKTFARKLASELESNEIRVWIDEAEIKVGDSLMDKISHAIDEADFIAVVLSSTSVASEWVMAELKMAMTRELADRQVRVLPILKDKCEIPLFLRDKLYADFTASRAFEEPFDQLLLALGAATPTAFSASPLSLGEGVSPKEARGAVGTADMILGRTDISASGNFEDIQIIGIDRDLTYRPDETKALFDVYLTLSSIPPPEWIELFEVERQIPRHSMWRRAWIEDDNIVIHCTPEEVKERHLADLKQDVQAVNGKYRNYLRRSNLEEARRLRTAGEEERSLDKAFDGLEL